MRMGQESMQGQSNKAIRQHHTASGLRKNMTDAERRLWHVLRGRQMHGYKFRRQYPVGRYILDFYCAELKLAIEVDGRQHGECWMAGYEDERLLALRERGIEVLRIPNELLIRDAVMTEECIRAAIISRR